MTKVQTVIVNSEDNDIRLDRWFKRNYPSVSHVSIEKALRKGQIRVDGKRVKASHRLKTGEIVRVPPMVEYVREPKAKPEIDKKYISAILESVIYKDDDIIIINKPADMAVQGGVGVKVSIDAILDHLKFDYEERPKLVHRLDKDTSGILLLARKTSVAAKFGEYFKNKNIEKIYWAIVVGVPEVNEGKVDLPLLKKDTGAGKEKVVVDEEGQTAITFFRVLEKVSDKMSLVELRPITGRTHQLRVHMAEIGTPILGDGKYGGADAFIDGMPEKMHLHARQITIPDYKKPFVAKLNGVMQETFDMLGMSS
ncbi:MAG: rluC [Rickettsiaceae bacterium]|jgi:23S rRNA pseudouridine955/2504/2580 synthase|nr:rluC [Rickettsiaceae bacterium]